MCLYAYKGAPSLEHSNTCGTGCILLAVLSWRHPSTQHILRLSESLNEVNTAHRSCKLGWPTDVTICAYKLHLMQYAFDALTREVSDKPHLRTQRVCEKFEQSDLNARLTCWLATLPATTLSHGIVVVIFSFHMFQEEGRGDLCRACVAWNRGRGRDDRRWRKISLNSERNEDLKYKSCDLFGTVNPLQIEFSGSTFIIQWCHPLGWWWWHVGRSYWGHSGWGIREQEDFGAEACWLLYNYSRVCGLVELRVGIPARFVDSVYTFIWLTWRNM